MPMIPPQALTLMSELSDNNTKDWYAAHRDRFDAELRAPFAAVLEAASERLAGSIQPMIGSTKTMFRQHRDTRFSKNKLPYKTSVSGLLTPSGAKSEGAGLIYLHLDPGGGFVAAGYHQLPTDQLGLIRARIIEQPARFTEVLESLALHDLHLDLGGALKRMPKGFTEHANHPHAELVRLKNFITRQPLSAQAWASGTVVDDVVHHTLACADLFGFMERALGR